MISYVFAAALAAAAPAQQAQSPAAACPDARPQAVRVDPRAPGQYKRLDQLPPAGQVLTVIKSVGGCYVTVVKVGDRHYDVPSGGTRQVRREDVTPRRR
jgi:hypothetical protein